MTKIHSTAFGTPSLFVNVLFKPQDASEANYFVAGKPKETCTNRIVGMLRTSDKRTKADFDAVAEQIEKAWYEVVSGEVVEDEEKDTEGKKGKETKNGDGGEHSERLTEARRLLFVAFYRMIAARELGTVIRTVISFSILLCVSESGNMMVTVTH